MLFLPVKWRRWDTPKPPLVAHVIRTKIPYTVQLRNIDVIRHILAPVILEDNRMEKITRIPVLNHRSALHVLWVC